MMNGVIWSKIQKTFVPISSVPAFAMVQQERFRQSRALEIHNFQLQNLTMTSFQEPHFFEFYDNDMKVTGLCGDLWTLLSESLNFTLQPVKSNETSVGVSEKNQTVFVHGLLGLISRNETIAIPKIETYNVRRIATDFTMPLWMNSQRLYVRHEIIHDVAWMTKVFSWKIWCFILIMHLLLSICSFWSQVILVRIKKHCKHSSLGDHIFYSFGMLCNQNYIPNVLVGRSRILETSLGLFCSVLFMAFGAFLFIFIKKINFTPPFNDLDSLFTDTSYKVVVLRDSIADIAFKVSSEQHFVQLKNAKRVVIVSSLEEMFKLVCTSGKKKYAVLQGEDEHEIEGQIKCHTIPVGKSYLNMWIASGIVKNFKYKKTIDLGILKIKEVGLWSTLTKRWLIKQNKFYHVKAEPIGIDQISLIILMMICGMMTAFIILIIEKIVYAYKRKPL